MTETADEPKVYTTFDEIEDEENQLIFNHRQRETSSGDPRLDIVSGWMPEDKDWQAKTHITPEQAQALGVLRSYAQIYPQLGGWGDVLLDVIEDYEKYLTSIDARAREDQVRVLQSLSGGPTGDQKDFGSMLMAGFQARNDED